MSPNTSTPLQLLDTESFGTVVHLVPGVFNNIKARGAMGHVVTLKSFSLTGLS